MAKDYYAILGVKPDATQSQIKAAYRRLAKEHHPDSSGKDSKDFRDLQEAYKVLSDPKQRAAYDRTRRTTGGVRIPVEVRRSGQAGVVHPVAPESRRRIFEEEFPPFGGGFEWLRDWLSPASAGTAGPRHLRVEVSLTASEATRGGEVHITLPVRLPCPTCGGRVDVWPFTCLHCGAKGEIEREVSLEVPFPAGVKHGQAVEVPLESVGLPRASLRVYFRIEG